MKIGSVVLSKKAKAEILAAVVVVAAVAGIAVAVQLTSHPQLELSPSTSLAGNPVTISVIPPGIIGRGHFFQLRNVTYAPANGTHQPVPVADMNGYTGTQVFNRPGRYVVAASFIYGGTEGKATAQLTVLPSNFSAAALRYGDSAEYRNISGSLTASDPFGIYSVPFQTPVGSSSLSVISIGLQLTGNLSSSVSSSSFEAADALLAQHRVFAVNSTLNLSGTGYVNALAAGIGMNLTAQLRLAVQSESVMTVAGGEAIAQNSSATYSLSLVYGGRTISIVGPTSTLIASFSPVALQLPPRLLFSSLGDNGTFALSQSQMHSYSSHVPPAIDMGLNGTACGYSWTASTFVPGVGTSSLIIGMRNVNGTLPGAYYTLTLDSGSPFPEAYSIHQSGTTGNLTTGVQVDIGGMAAHRGSETVPLTSASAFPEGRGGSYIQWSAATPPLNDTSVLPVGLASAVENGSSLTSLSGYLAGNGAAFISSASYNYTNRVWYVTFSSPGGNGYLLNVTFANGSVSATGRDVPLTPEAQPGGGIMTLQSMLSLLRSSPYAPYFLNSSGDLGISDFSFAVNRPYLPVLTPFIPPPSMYAPVEYLLTSNSGATVAFDASGGQLLYFIS